MTDRRAEYRVEPVRRRGPGGLRIALELEPEPTGPDGIPIGCPVRDEFADYYTPAVAVDTIGPPPHPCADCAWAIHDEEMGHPVPDAYVTVCGSPERTGPTRITRVQAVGSTGQAVTPRRRRRSTDPPAIADHEPPRRTGRRRLPSEDEARAAYERIQKRREERYADWRATRSAAKATRDRGPTQARAASRSG